MRDPGSGIRRPEGEPAMPRDALKRYKQANTPAYDQAVDNVLADLWHAEINPHGNITEIAQAALAVQRAGDDPPDFAARAAKLRSPQPASGANPCRPTPAEPLRRVVPYSWFLNFHLGSGLTGIRNVRDMPLPDEAHEVIPFSQFTGRVGRKDTSSWWTFDRPAPVEGEAYMAELALPETTLSAAHESACVVEIPIPHTHFPVDLFKPSALDGFMKDSRFVPDCSSCVHGWSAPAEPQFKKRPELVSESFAYRDVKPGLDTITVAYFPIRVKSDS